MKSNRRNFIQTAGMITAGSLLLPSWGCNDAPKEKTAETSTPTPEKTSEAGSLDEFGIQLYTLRDVITEAPMATIKQLSKMGYKQIESFEREPGMFWGMSNTDFKAFLDDLDMKIVSSHCNIYENFEQKAAEAAEIDMKYLVCPYVGPQKSMDDWKKVTEKFNECGEICKKNGIGFAYHNHAYTFKAFSGMIPHDFLMENTDPDLVKHQMDIYWVVTGGADPIEYLTKYSNRFTLCHVKDRKKDVPADDHKASCDLGTGVIDFPKILKVAKDNGMEFFIMEQEKYENSTPMDSAKVGAEYLKKLTFA